jgi:hypothetical protein
MGSLTPTHTPQKMRKTGTWPQHLRSGRVTLEARRDASVTTAAIPAAKVGWLWLCRLPPEKQKACYKNIFVEIMEKKTWTLSTQSKAEYAEK